MAAQMKPEQQSESTAVVKRRELAPERQAVVEEAKQRNALVAQIRGTMWGRECSADVVRAVAHYCNENGLDAVRHVEVLGGRIYLTAEFYDERGAALMMAGQIIADEPDYINADPRLEKLAAEGDEWGQQETTRRLRERIKYGVPEKAAAAVVQRFRIAATGQVVLGVNWCGGGTRQRDPVGEAEPTKTAQTRARRRAWKQIAEVIPGYAAAVQPVEARAKLMTLPVATVDAPQRGPRAIASSSYGQEREDDGAPLPGRNDAVSAEDPYGLEGQAADGEFALDDERAPARRTGMDAGHLD